MASDLPELYFRVRENGAMVFRVDTQNRQARLDLVQVAVINLRSGEVKDQSEGGLSDSEKRAIGKWIHARRAMLEERTVDDIRRTIDHLNLTAQWAQAQASPAQLEAITDELLLAMHDLRMVLVRRKSERLAAAEEEDTGGDSQGARGTARG